MSQVPLRLDESTQGNHWLQQCKAAGAKWDKLEASELQALDGSERALANLIRDRYSLSRAEAEHQVASFFCPRLPASRR
ncbi:hypothetical protein [Pseudomarimonas salicorniae]|uniref:General stress protein CsbD n=1 Tax=Pseudomarimonas salicorniae TaxID=2933270 RepID=A0ABT0GET9_9GAMM|nr:hypothetical protein [Lysobacter sp. CAU 1642]MCK7593056.1 hypothetical protein [Lysobacter sp. CAU 1642]